MSPSPSETGNLKIAVNASSGRAGTGKNALTKPDTGDVDSTVACRMMRVRPIDTRAAQTPALEMRAPAMLAPMDLLPWPLARLRRPPFGEPHSRGPLLSLACGRSPATTFWRLEPSLVIGTEPAGAPFRRSRRFRTLPPTR